MSASSSKQCSRCGHFNPVNLDRCEKCYNKLDPSTTVRAIKPSSRKKSPPPPITYSGPSTVSTPPATTAGSTHSSSKIIPSAGAPIVTPPALGPISPLPADFSKLGVPPLEGNVVDTREIQFDKKAHPIGYLFDGLLLLIDRSIGVASLFNRMSRRDKITAYIVRVQRADGSQRTAQMQGNFQGAPMEIGDYVSIWGNVENGVVNIRTAFNHTTNVEIVPKG